MIVEIHVAVYCKGYISLTKNSTDFNIINLARVNILQNLTAYLYLKNGRVFTRKWPKPAVAIKLAHGSTFV